MTGIAATRCNAILPAVIGSHRPEAVVYCRRTSFHLQRCWRPVGGWQAAANADEANRCHAVNMSIQVTAGLRPVFDLADQAAWTFGGPKLERGLGVALAVVVGMVCVIALASRSAFTSGQPAVNAPGRVEAAIAAIMAYVF